MQVEEQHRVALAGSKSEMPRRTKVIRPVTFSPAALFEGFAELLQYRDLLYTLTLHRIKVRYKQSALGIGWAVFQPLALMLVYTVIFSLFIRFPTGTGHYSLFVLAGLAPWNFFQTSLSSAATGLVTHTQLITKVYFPREIVPLSYVLASFVDFLISCVILVAMMAWYHVGTTVNALYLIPILLVVFAFTSGIGFFLSALQVRLRDIGLAMPLILQLWMFGSPVVYSFANVPRRFRSLYELNPMTGIVENFRRVLIDGVGADLRLLSISALFALITLPATYLYFKYRESTMADVI
jgi:lipopolysaccharide transport system permease protein